MYQTSSLLSDLSQTPIPAGTQAYVTQRAKNAFYDYVLERFLVSGISRSDLARRLGKEPARVTRLLSNPGNWTIETISELLAAISAEELIPASEKFAGRPRKNSTQRDLLFDDETNHPSFPPKSEVERGVNLVDFGISLK